MSDLPFSLPNLMVSKGWEAGWKEARARLAQNRGILTPEAGRLLCQERLTVKGPGGSLLVSAPVAMALETLAFENQTPGQPADKSMQTLHGLFRDFFNDYRHTQGQHPVHEAVFDEGLALPTLGTLWLIAWTVQGDNTFTHWRSGTGGAWPDQFFRSAAGSSYDFAALKRLMIEANQAAPVLLAMSQMSEGGAKVYDDELKQIGRTLYTVHKDWRMRLRQGEETKKNELDEMFHTTIQSGCMVPHSLSSSKNDVAKKMAFNERLRQFFRGPAGPKRLTASQSLTRVVDTLAFFLTPNGLAISQCGLDPQETLNQFMGPGAVLNNQDPCHERRIAQLQAHYPALAARLREYQTLQNPLANSPLPLLSPGRIRQRP